MFHYDEISVPTSSRCHWVDITRKVSTVLDNLAISNGIVTISSQHTTCGITINENADPDVERDFFWKLEKVFPKDTRFYHQEGNSDSHLKTSFTGLSAQVPILDTKMVLGIWQSIYLCEFDGPRSRRISITVMGD